MPKYEPIAQEKFEVLDYARHAEERRAQKRLWAERMAKSGTDPTQTRRMMAEPTPGEMAAYEFVRKETDDWLFEILALMEDPEASLFKLADMVSRYGRAAVAAETERISKIIKLFFAGSDHVTAGKDLVAAISRAPEPSAEEE